MENKELTDIILRNVGGAKSALTLLGACNVYDQKDKERHRSYLDALKGYFNIYNENLAGEQCLKGVQDYLISQYSFFESGSPAPEIDKEKITNSKIERIIYYGQFLLIGTPFTMITPINYIIGGFGMACIVAHKLKKDIAERPYKISRREKREAKKLHEEYKGMRDDLRNTPFSAFDEILQANRERIVPLLQS